MAQLFALVKWLGGEDNGSYSVGIPTEWIMNFCYDEFKKDDYDPDMTYVIEWRKGKRPPGGWKAYDGLVTEVSSSIAVLEKKFKQNYSGILSPKDLSTAKQNTPPPSDAENRKQKPDKQNAPPPINDENRRQKPDEQNAPPPISDENRRQKPVPDNDPGKTKTPEIDETPKNPPNVEPRKNLFAPTNEENNLNAQILKELQNMRKELNKKLKGNEESDSTDSENEDPKIEIGKRGSGLMITKEQWQCAKSQGRCTAMATALLTAMVPIDILLKSNCKGGKARINKDPNNPNKHQPLDPAILQAIKHTVRKNFKKTYNDVIINTALNVKMNSLRRRFRRTNAPGTSASHTDDDEASAGPSDV